MADDRQSTSAAGGARGYKRSWKNLLINKRYQLRFTLFMVAVSAILMLGLGWWVMKVADEATHVQQNNVMSGGCSPAVLAIPAPTKDEDSAAAAGDDDANTDTADAADAADADDDDADEATPVVKEEDNLKPAAKPVAAPPPAAADKADKPEPEEKKTHAVSVEETGFTFVAKVPVADLVTREGYRANVIVRIEYTADDPDKIPDQKEIANQLEPVVEDAARARLGETKLHDLFAGDLDILEAAAHARDTRLGELQKAVAEAKSPPEKADAQKTLDDAKAAFAVPMVGVHVEQPVLNPQFMTEVAGFYECNYAQLGRLHRLDDGRARILYVLFGSCALLTIGLAVYGIKMTHKVAGPLYKITLYMGKMRDGRLDKVYNLRKGDQLVDFYEHFKTAHAGVVDLEKADIAQLQAVIAAADKAGISGKSPEVDAALAEMRELLARKEKSLE